MAIDLDNDTKQLIAAAVARGEFPDEETAVNTAVASALDDYEWVRPDIEAGLEDLRAGRSITVEEWRAKRKARTKPASS